MDMESRQDFSEGFEEELLDSQEENLSDFALFLSVMRHKKAYQNVLSIIMEEREIRLVKVRVEEVILNKRGRRAIRLDACAQDEGGRNFAAEMQNDTSKDNMPKRARFYQSLLDTPILKAGRKTKYRELPPTIIIFITQDDIFRRGRAKYTFLREAHPPRRGMCYGMPFGVYVSGTMRGRRGFVPGGRDNQDIFKHE